MKRCPGYSVDAASIMDDDEWTRVICEGSAEEYHVVAAHPHAFCGCGTDADQCHPGRCCKDDNHGQCVNCGLPAPDPDPTPESELSDGLWTA